DSGEPPRERTGEVRQALPIPIVVKDDGTFDPPSLTINEGETVQWVGEHGALAPTDNITRIAVVPYTWTKEQICAAVTPPARACGPRWREFIFPGPKGRGLWGIYGRTRKGRGYIETATPAAPATATTCAAVLGAGYDTVKVRVTQAGGVTTYHFLCDGPPTA